MLRPAGMVTGDRCFDPPGWLPATDVSTRRDGYRRQMFRPAGMVTGDRCFDPPGWLPATGASTRRDGYRRQMFRPAGMVTGATGAIGWRYRPISRWAPRGMTLGSLERLPLLFRGVLVRQLPHLRTTGLYLETATALPDPDLYRTRASRICGHVPRHAPEDLRHRDEHDCDRNCENPRPT